MSALDQMIADALAQSPDTVIHQLASEVVRLRSEIADLKRGGVVVPDITDEDFESVSVLMQENGIGYHDSENDSFRRIVASTWAYAQGAFVDLSRLRTIPADRVPGEGMRQVDARRFARMQFEEAERPCLLELERYVRTMAKLQYWSKDTMVHGPLSSLDRLRANQGGASC